MKLRAGYVVNIKDDPTRSGRVKVRIFNHQDDTQNVSDDDLPWCLVSQPITSAATHKVGKVPCGLRVGSRVLLGYLDTDYEQLYPIILGSIARGDLDQSGNG
jgi:uncharacterized protein involved in type VI secretion and phage assembly